MTSKSAFLNSPLSFAALLIGVLAVSQAHAAGDASANAATSQSSTVASRTESADVDSSRDLESALISVQQLQEDSRQNASELNALKETVKAQSRLIEELKRNNGTTLQTSNADVSGLKSKLDEQSRTISKLESQLNDLKRSTGSSSSSSSNSSSSDLSSLKSKVEDQNRSISNLESKLSDVQRSSGSNSNSSSSDISSLRQDISNLRSSVGRLESQVSSLSSKVK